jgi:hypothetical protein
MACSVLSYEKINGNLANFPVWKIRSGIRLTASGIVHSHSDILKE